MLKEFIFYFVVVLLHNQITCLSLRHRREVTAPTYKLCDSTKSETSCGKHGTCYTNQLNEEDVFCRCNDDYFGEKCENKENTILEPIVFGIAIFAAILLVILIVLTIKYCRHKSCNHDDEKSISHNKPIDAVMYSETDKRKSSMASSVNSIDQKYVIDQNDHSVSFSSKDAPDATITGKPKENISMLEIQIPSHKNNLALPHHAGQGKEEDEEDFDDEDNASVISDSNLSTTESDRNLISAPVSNVSPSANSNLSDHEESLYDQYFAQRLLNEKKLAASGYYPQPDTYTMQTYSPTKRSPNTSPHGSPREPGMMTGTSPTRSTHSNQMFLYTNNPHQTRTLHPHNAGRVQKKITPPSRFAPPQPRANAHNKHRPRQRSPARQHQQQLHPQQQYRDARGRPLSLGDLRIMDEDMRIAASAIQNQRMRARSMENILMVEDRPMSASSTSSLTSSVQSSNQVKNPNAKKNNNKRPGLWAQTQMR